MKKAGVIFTALMFVLCTDASFGDVPGSKDHPMLSRFPGSTIKHYFQKEFNEFCILCCSSKTGQIDVEKSSKLKLEGKVTKIQYSIPANRSAFEVFKNYELAVKKAGFEIVCEGKAKNVRNFLDKVCGFWDLRLYTSENPRDHFYLSARNPARDKFISVYVGQGSFGRPTVAAVGIVEAKNIETGLITAREMKSSLELSGHVAVYGIQFDFNKADIKPESEPTIKQVAKLLKDNPKISVYIVGHTDNVGKLEYNLNLSRKRALAVVEELAGNYGIEKHRLKAFGVGPLCPVASNKTEKGRAKNRRVEIVEK